MHAIKTPPHYVADFNDARAAPALKELTSIELKWQYKSGAALSLGIFYKQKSFIYPQAWHFHSIRARGR